MLQQIAIDEANSGSDDRYKDTSEKPYSDD